MKIFKKLIVAFIVLVSAKAIGQTEQKSLDILAGSFIKELRTDGREKILLQTDKWYYIAGEDIWFCAYCINSLSHKISHHSKIVFADLVNDRDSIITRLLINNQTQKPEGKIALPLSLPEGYYWLRAYTRSMQGSDSNDISVEPLYVFNAKKINPIEADEPTDQNDISLSDTSRPVLTFFPEGGSLISGTTAVIAFRAVDKNGLALDVSGWVTDSWDTVVSKFRTSMPGLGKLSFFVWKSRKYTAHIKWAGNKEFTYPLPLVDQYASQLSVTEQNDKYIHAQVSLGDSIYKKNKLSYLLAISRDSLCFAAVGRDMYDFTLPKEKFPDGKTTLLLFNEDRKIVSERNIYIEKNNPGIVISTDKEKYAAREKAKLDIETFNSNKMPALALLSLVVTDDSLAKEPVATSRLAEMRNDNIELPLAIHHSDTLTPVYSPEQWDLIMLTQKNNYAERFNAHHSNNNYDSFMSIKDEDSSVGSINGKVVDSKNNPVKKRVITLFSNKNEVIFKHDTTDEGGRFHFRLPDQQDSVQFILQVADMKGRLLNEKIIVDTFSYPDMHTPAHLKKKFSQHEIEMLQNFKTYQLSTLSFGIGKGWLKPVTVKGVKKKELSYNDSKRVSQFSKIITPDKFEQGGVGGITNALLMVPGVHYVNGRLTIEGGSYDPLVVLDGTVMDLTGPTIASQTNGKTTFTTSKSAVLDVLESIPPATIDFIEILSGQQGSIYGMNGSSGVILINTTSKLRTNNEAIGLIKYTPKGYFTSPLFDEPNYDNKEIKKSVSPDQRSTIYWNGNVLTDSTGKASLHFFTADEPSSYSITVSGITVNGEIISKKVKIYRR
jgi:TonB-dependent receptor-like protein